MPSTTRAAVRLVVAGGAALIAVALVAASAPDFRHASAPEDLDLTRPTAPVSRSAERSDIIAMPEPPAFDYAQAVEDKAVEHYLQAVHAERVAEEKRQAEERRRAREAAAAEGRRLAAERAAAKAAAPPPPKAPSNTSAAANRALGQEMAAARGWTGNQWACLDSLWGANESGWNERADNPTSSAYGIPQALPGSKMGPGWQTDPVVQIRWGLGYIAGRYGTPCSALSARKAKGWY